MVLGNWIVWVNDDKGEYFKELFTSSSEEEAEWIADILADFLDKQGMGYTVHCGQQQVPVPKAIGLV